ncbi:MAG: LuxR C-terminal-related transcriptional regulator [Thiohalomonadaceae bacterium]
MDTQNTFNLFLCDRLTVQTLALADFLARATGYGCRVVDQLPQAANTPQAMVLANADGRDPMDVLRRLSADAELGDPAKVCLLNVTLETCTPDILNNPFLKGLFGREADHRQLARGIEAVFGGELWLPRRLLVAHMLLTRRCGPRQGHPATPTLTAKELEILTRLSSGSTNAHIARELRVSVHTVKTDAYNLFRKLGVRNRTQATAWANRYLAEQPGAGARAPDTRHLIDGRAHPVHTH